jgi:hypothetical protein
VNIDRICRTRLTVIDDDVDSRKPTLKTKSSEAIYGRGCVKTIFKKSKWGMHTKFRLESIKKWVIEYKIRMVFKRMWEIFYRQYQYSEFSHSLGQ